MALHKQASQNGIKNESSSHSQKIGKLLYESNADGTLLFEDGQVLHVSKTLLAFKSEYFHDIFFGSSPVAKVKIKGFERETFQIFLNCWFGLKEECSVSDALSIYPIAHKYDAKECLEKCVSALKPTKMDANVCLSLNLAIFYKCDVLVDDIVAFLKRKFGIIALMKNPIYCNLLEPRTILKLTEHIDLDSYSWKLIYDWGKNYVENGSKDKDIRTFLTENNILEKFSFSQFESIESILDFHKLTDKRLLDSDKIVEFLENPDNATKEMQNFSEQEHPPKKNKVTALVNIKKKESIRELIVFKTTFIVSSKDSENGYALNLQVNPCFVLKPMNNSKFSINCKVRLNYRCKTTETPVFSGDISSRDSVFGSVYEAEINFSDQSSVLSLPINVSSLIAEISSVELTYTFSHGCKILKTSFKKNRIAGNELYFTKDVFYAKDWEEHLPPLSETCCIS